MELSVSHSIGLRSNATMLFGNSRRIALHIFKALGLHFIFFHLENAEPGLHIRHKANPVDVLKTIAISRIVLRNFRSIRAYWVTLGTKLAQVALNYGANDLDGTLMGEKVTHAAGAKTPNCKHIGTYQRS